MWIYTYVSVPILFGIYRQQWERPQLVSIEGARVFIHQFIKTQVLVAEYSTGKRIGLFAGSLQEAQQNFQFILQAIESGYNYLDLAYVRMSLGPLSKPAPVEVVTPVPTWEPPTEAQRSARNWLAPQYRRPEDPVPDWETPDDEPNPANDA